MTTINRINSTKTHNTTNPSSSTNPNSSPSNNPNSSSSSKLTKPSSAIINSINSTFNALFFSSDYGLLTFLILLFLVIGIGFVILFEVGMPNIRSQMINNVVGVTLGITLIIVIFHQMGHTITLFERKLDIGLIYYLLALMAVMLIFSN